MFEAAFLTSPGCPRNRKREFVPVQYGGLNLPAALACHQPRGRLLAGLPLCDGLAVPEWADVLAIMCSRASNRAI